MYDPDKDCEAMIAKIKGYCRKKNLTISALAQKAGVSTSTVSYLLSGRTKPQIYTVLLICNVLDISIDQLFDSPRENSASDGHKIEAQFAVHKEEELLRMYQSFSQKKKELLWIYMDMLMKYDEI